MKDERKPSMIEPAGTDVKHLYPEIVEYWISKGMPEQHIEITSSPYIEEDVLYLYGRFFGYCRNENEWKQLQDLKNKHVKTERLRKILNTEVPEKVTMTKEEIDGRSYVVVIDRNKMNTALNSPRVTVNTKLTREEKRELILSYADEQPQELDSRIYNVIKGRSKCSDRDYTYKEGSTIEDLKEAFKND